MRAIILSIGDELVLGQTVDTNSAWLSRELAAVGCAVAAHVTVGDDQKGIEQAMLEAVGRCDALVVTGGIGPTEDDLTRQALAAVMDVELEMNPTWLAKLEGFFAKIGRPMSPLNRVQAMIPKGATMIDNAAGTAAGIDATYVAGDQKTICRIFVMPGVPKEMKAMFACDVLPHVRAEAGGATILSRTLHTFGRGESDVAAKLGDLMSRSRNPSVGTTVSAGIVSLRLNARFDSIEEAAKRLKETEGACRAALGDLIFGQDDEPLQNVVTKLLIEGKATVATAESCTGGLLAKMLTDMAGSSAAFLQGWVTYTNAAKTELLGVPESTLIQYGAVSEPTVRAMAAGAAERSGAKFALSISGIAGPGGGSEEKPVGTVCFGLASPDAAREGPPDVVTRTFVFTGDREMIRDRAAKMALTILRFKLLGKKMPF